MGQSPQLLQTVRQDQALEQKETGKEMCLLQQKCSWTRFSTCPMATWRKQATWMKSSKTCTIPQRTCTLCQESSATLSYQSLQILTTLWSPTRTKSTSMAPTKQQSLFLGAKFSKDGDGRTQTYGESPSSKTSATTTPTQSSVIDAWQNFFPIDHCPTKPSRACRSSKQSLNF